MRIKLVFTIKVITLRLIEKILFFDDHVQSINIALQLQIVRAIWRIFQFFQLRKKTGAPNKLNFLKIKISANLSFRPFIRLWSNWKSANGFFLMMGSRVFVIVFVNLRCFHQYSIYYHFWFPRTLKYPFFIVSINTY